MLFSRCDNWPLVSLSYVYRRVVCTSPSITISTLHSGW